MSNLKIELNIPGIRALRKSPEIVAELERHANETLKALPDANGYGKSVFYGANRANVSVSAQTNSARRDNLENNTLLKALR